MIEKLWVDGCRNLHNQVVEFSNGATYIFGGNNQGKTSILEAIYLCANGVAPFQTDFRCIVSSNRNLGQCAADFKSENENYRVYVRLSASQKKDIQVNNQTVRSLRALKKKIHCEYLTADALHLFQKDPDFRRRFLDRLAERLIKGYESDLKKCERLLKQKNKLLKTNPTKDMIYILNQQIAEVAVKVVEKRIRILKELTETLEKLCRELDFLSDCNISLNYEKKRLVCNFDTYHDDLLKQLNDDYTKECLCGYSLVGPQRDDFTVRLNGKESFNYFSRGINRILAVLLYYTYMISVDDAFESVGILLLDDALAECDYHNRKKLIQYMEKKVQLIYVSTSKDDQCLFENVTSFEVKNGEVAYG